MTDQDGAHPRHEVRKNAYLTTAMFLPFAVGFAWVMTENLLDGNARTAFAVLVPVASLILLYIGDRHRDRRLENNAN